MTTTTTTTGRDGVHWLTSLALSSASFRTVHRIVPAGTASKPSSPTAVFPPVIDVDRDRLWGDGLAASSPVGLCRKFRREDSQKARLERQRAAVEHRDVQHRVSGFVGFRSSATRLSVHPLQLRGSRSLRKSRSQL